MLIIEKVQGESTQAKPIVKTAHTIFIHENIIPYVEELKIDNGIDDDTMRSSNLELFEYKEYQLDNDEYSFYKNISESIKSKKDKLDNYTYPDRNVLEIILNSEVMVYE